MAEHNPATIVFLLPALTSGGAERVLITLMNGLDRALFKPVLVSVIDKGSMATLVDPGIDIHILGGAMKTCLPRLFKTLKTLRPAIVVSTMAHMNFAALILSPFFKDAAFIVREAITPSFLLSKYRKTAPLLKLFYKFLYPRAALVLSPAQAIIDEFTALGLGNAPHRLLENPVDLRHIRSLENLPGRDQPIVTEYVCVGRLHPQKGYDRLIDALPALERADWHLTFIGSGEEERRLQIQARKAGLDEKITFAGALDEPWPYMAAADCLLLPSRWEGLPNVVLESLAAGTKVIATAESGGIAEIAARAAPGAVTVVQSMSAFITAMKDVKAQPVRDYRPSLLPAAYEKNAVQEKFVTLLAEARARIANRTSA